MKPCAGAICPVGIGISEAPVSPAVQFVGEDSRHLPDMTESGILDRNHLAHITLGDRALEREVLGLFHRQAAMLLARMANQVRRVIAALAHTLTGGSVLGKWRRPRRRSNAPQPPLTKPASREPSGAFPRPSPERRL
jgi:hypothetical protein